MDNARSLKPDGFFWLLIAIFLLRGIAIQCLYPPLEGPDEYQHIAVIHYLVENRVLPVFGQSKVPVSLYDDIVANPHPNHSADQTRRIGAQSYETFYDTKPVRSSDVPIRLYQAQHPPLYYILMAPLYSWSRSELDFRSTVYLLRFVNLVVAAFAVVFLLYPLRCIVADERLYRLFALTVAASPMYMINISRVTNDAFALLFAGSAVILVVRIIGSTRPYITTGFSGTLVGISVLFKLTSLVLLPSVLAYFVILALLSRITWRRCILCGIVFVASYLVVCLPYHLWSQSHFGSVIFDQVSSGYKSSGFTMLDMPGMMRLEHFRSVLAKGIVLSNLWTSGWSFLGVPRSFRRVYMILLLLSAGGCFAWLQIRLRTAHAPLIRDWRPLLVCFILTCAMVGAMYQFALKYLVVVNALTIPSYYFMIAYPAFLSCVFVAALGYGPRMAGVFALLLLMCFTFTELYGLCFVAAPYWAQSQQWPVILSRLASLHPGFPAPAYFFVLYPIALVLLLMCVRRIFTSRYVCT